MAKLTEFQSLVVQRVKEIPFGRVVSYGQIAASIASPRSARQVGWTLRGLELKEEIPWWRVINNAGRITIKGNIINDAEIQRKLLEAEGVEVSNKFTIEIEKYRYHYPQQA